MVKYQGTESPHGSPPEPRIEKAYGKSIRMPAATNR